MTRSCLLSSGSPLSYRIAYIAVIVLWWLEGPQILAVSRYAFLDEVLRGVNSWIGMHCAAAADAILQASKPVTTSPPPEPARTVASMPVSTLTSPLRRGERTYTSHATGLVSSATSIMPTMLPPVVGGHIGAGSEMGIRPCSDTTLTLKH